MRNLLTIFLVMSVMITVGAVHADVILIDDAVFGADSVIRDVSNQMDFLCLDHTAGYPYVDILLEFGQGGDFEGWRVASKADMDLLGSSAGVVDMSTDPTIIANAEQLRDWFGNVRLSSSHEVARGLISDTVNRPQGTFQAAFNIGRRFNVVPHEVYFRMAGYGPIYANESTFLVRDPAITKCNVKAGKSRGKDTIRFSGLLSATESDLVNAMGMDVVVNIDAADMPSPLNFIFPINNVSFKNGTYNYARLKNAKKSFFKFNPRNGKVNFKVKKIDLTGLACPVTVTVTIGSYSTTLQLDEDIVNGPKRPCPPQLLMSVKNSLTVGKAKVKFGKKPNTDSLSVKGFFTIDGMNYDKSNPLVIVLGNQTFTVPGNQIIKKRAIERCSKVSSNEGGYVSVRFDFSKCKYSIAIKKADITETGTVNFGVQLFDKDLLGFANLDL